MTRFLLFLFSIPVASFAFIAIYQIVDEMRKKTFVLERRAQAETERNATGPHRRRYSDPVPPGTLRNPETATSSTGNEVTVPQVHGA